MGPLRQAALKKRLIARTLRYAVDHLEFYRRALGEWRPGLQLADFPVVDKACMDAQFEQFTNFSEFPEIAFTTGGTTRAPSATLQTRSEIDRMISYAYDFRVGEPYPQSAIDRFTLHVGGAGQLPVGPRGAPLLSLPLAQAGQAELIGRILDQGLLVKGRRRRVGTLLAPARELKLLTRVLRQGKGSSRRHALDKVLVYSDHVTLPWRKCFKEFWGPDITPLYGLSEFNYAVSKCCPVCSHHHFPAYVYQEVLTPDRRRVIDGGDGVLVLTSLYPFVRGHPHIRYWTGDVVRIGPWCEVAQDRGIRFLGRLQHCKVVEAGGQWECILSAIDILEACEMVDGLAFEEAWSDQSVVTPSRTHRLAVAGPVVRINTGTPEPESPVTLEIGVQDEHTDAMRGSPLADHLVAAIRSVSPRASAALDSQRLNLDIQAVPARVLLASRGYQPLA